MFVSFVLPLKSTTSVCYAPTLVLITVYGKTRYPHAEVTGFSYRSGYFFLASILFFRKVLKSLLVYWSPSTKTVGVP